MGVRDMDEDCLYLNVFAPDIVSVFIYLLNKPVPRGIHFQNEGIAQKYPVMVYIHGGVTFTAKVIREELALESNFIQNGTKVESALRFQRDINRCLAQYDQVYKDFTKNAK